MVYDPARVGQNCEFCGSPALVDYQEIKSPIRPQSVLPFKVSQTDVRDSIRRWYASKWFAPDSLKRRALVDQLKSLYIPYWTFDAQVHCPWTAEAGSLLLRQRGIPRQPGPRAGAAGPQGALGASRRRARPFLRRRAGARDAGRGARSAQAGGAVPDRRAGALRHRLPVGARGRALPGRAGRRGSAGARVHGRPADDAVRQPGAGRHLPQPADRPATIRARRSSTSSCRSGS